MRNVASTSAVPENGYVWFRSRDDVQPYLNDTAVRIRASIMMIVPIFMAYTLLNVIFGSRWEVTGNVIKDTFDTDFDGRILYMVEAVRRTYDYSVQTWFLLYALFEMLVSMSARTSFLSPTIWLSRFLAKSSTPVWKPLAPKRFAWGIGASMISVCLVFFHPEKFAAFVNMVTTLPLLPTTQQYLPRWLPLLMVWICLAFMWLEATLGFCVGCKVHALFVKFGWVAEDCDECNNLNY